jgi:hypothetical protein
MVTTVQRWFRKQADEPWVRPWGMAAPIAVILVCLPLLRPLRQPDPTRISSNELARLATIQAIAEHQTLAIDDSSCQPPLKDRIRPVPLPNEVRMHRYYSKQEPVLALFLAGPYWLMRHFGLTLEKNLTLTRYLLTILGSTLPVALAAGIIYRMARLFELPRIWRMSLAFAAAFGSGLISYATVLNAHTPAAALILAACGALFHAGMSRQLGQSHAWLALGGIMASLAAVIDFGTVVFLFLLVLFILAMRWPMASRIGGALWYVLGAMPALALHAVLMVPVTGDIRPGFLHPELQLGKPATQAVVFDEDQDEAPSGLWLIAGHLADGLIGPHGLFSHFPILLMGLVGMALVLHRNWPASTKMLVIVTIGGTVAMIAGYAILNADWRQPMFAVRWFVPCLPLTIFWAGAWLRRGHHAVTWSLVSLLLVFSILVSLIGSTAPFIQTRDGQYTAWAAARQLLPGIQAPHTDKR